MPLGAKNRAVDYHVAVGSLADQVKVKTKHEHQSIMRSADKRPFFRGDHCPTSGRADGTVVSRPAPSVATARSPESALAGQNDKVRPRRGFTDKGQPQAN